MGRKQLITVALVTALVQLTARRCLHPSVQCPRDHLPMAGTLGLFVGLSFFQMQGIGTALSKAVIMHSGEHFRPCSDTLLKTLNGKVSAQGLV